MLLASLLSAGLVITLIAPDATNRLSPDTAASRHAADTIRIERVGPASSTDIPPMPTKHPSVSTPRPSGITGRHIDMGMDTAKPMIRTDSIFTSRIQSMPGRGIPEASRPGQNFYEPDDSTLRNLGFHRIGKDTIVRFFNSLTPVSHHIWKTTLLSNRWKSETDVKATYDGSIPLAEIEELYSAVYPDGVTMFKSRQFGGIQVDRFVKRFFERTQDTAALAAMRQEEELALRDSAAQQFSVFVDSTRVDGPRTYRSSTRPPEYGYFKRRSTSVSVTKQENETILADWRNELSAISRRYRDSCVVIRIRCGDTGLFHFLYLPTPDFLARLPQHVARQIRAELGDRKALGELRDTYSGCRYLSYCRVSDGAIVASTVTGSSPESFRVMFSLSEPRTMTITLYTIEGQIAGELVSNAQFTPGDHALPLASRSVEPGFYLLVITTSSNEKVTHRVFLN